MIHLLLVDPPFTCSLKTTLRLSLNSNSTYDLSARLSHVSIDSPALPYLPPISAPSRYTSPLNLQPIDPHSSDTDRSIDQAQQWKQSHLVQERNSLRNNWSLSS